MSFTITSAAADELLAAARRSGATGMALRVAAKATPDGIDYGMGFDEAAREDDVHDFSGLTVVVGESSRRWLEATVLDYVEIEPGRRDFIFIPSAGGGGCATAASSCGGGGCGGCDH